MNGKPRQEPGWRQPILANFTAESAASDRLTIVGDPDGLLAEQGVVDAIRSRGFEIIPFDDHVAFRYAYESRFRQHWDRGDSTSLVVVLRSESADLGMIPFDLLEEARRASRLLSFSLVDIFPELSPLVVAELDRSDLDALYQAQQAYDPGTLGENGTRDYVLRHVFKIAPELISSAPDLLRVLLSRHYRSVAFPASLDEYFIQQLKLSGTWNDWPIERIVPDRSAFLDFLQERWPWFVLDQGHPQVPGREPRQPTMPGPRSIPFDHDDVRIYIDNLFVEGHLTPTPVVSKAALGESWYSVGVAGDPVSDAEDRLGRLVEMIREELPGPDSDHAAWQKTAVRWAEAVSVRWRLDTTAEAAEYQAFEELHGELESAFQTWMLERFPGLYNLAYLPRPVTVDKIASYIAHHRRKSANGQVKTALIVVDGLALDQWVLVREDIEAHLVTRLDESTVFAWVPTLTTVSRQAIFVGNAPNFFATSLSTTQKDPSHWKRFWEEEGLRGQAAVFVGPKKYEDEGKFLDRVREVIEHPKCRVAAIVVGTIDQMMHGKVTGTGGMHADIGHWLRQGHMRALVDTLLGQGYEIFLTSDHGNIESVGIGKPNVGAIADERGERVHVFRDELTRSKVQADHPETFPWPQVALPDDYRALLPAGCGAFISASSRIVAHGGISLEEVIVPFAYIEVAE